MKIQIGKFKLQHYINYIVIGLLTLVLGAVTLTGGRFDNSLLFLLEKVAISMILVAGPRRFHVCGRLPER